MIPLSGGENHTHQLVEYSTSNEQFTDHGESYLSSTLGNSDGEFQKGQYFTQINGTTMFTVNGNDTTINVYHLESLSYYTLDTTIPINVGIWSCITSSEIPVSKLYITGGWDSVEDSLSHELQILSLENLSWLQSAPAMIDGRYNHGCIVVNNRLWTIGGDDAGLGLDSVEAILIEDIELNYWYKNGTLPTKVARFGLLTVDDLIFIIGGYIDGDTHSQSDTVYIIDTQQNSISTYEYNLPYAVQGISVLFIDYTIYGFGGWGNYAYFNSLFTLDLLRDLHVTIPSSFCNILLELMLS